MAQQAKKAGKTGKKKRLTLKQSRFIKFFIKSGNGAEAVRKAGYKAGSKGGSKTKRQKQKTESAIGRENLEKLGHQLDVYYKKQNIDTHWVMKRLVAKVDLSKSEQIQLKALELIGKNKKMFTDRLETDSKAELNINIYIPDNKRDKPEVKVEAKPAENKKKEDKKNESS